MHGRDDSRSLNLFSTVAIARRNTAPGSSLFEGQRWEGAMLKGGLLWMIGIPIPIILILWFLGFLS